jgi:acetyl esterase/lipase
MSFSYESVYFDNPIQPGRAMDIFMPEKITRDVSLFFIHGGGWVAGSRDNYHKIMRGFNAEGYICTSVDYRLCNDSIHLLDQLGDLRHAYDIFISRLKNLNRPLKILTHGTSAGAHLCALISMAAPGQCGEKLEYNGRKLNNEWIRPIGTTLQATPVLFEPWEDIFPAIWTCMEKVIGIPYSENPELYRKAAPINYVNANTCPVFHLHAEDEHMFPLRYILEFKEKMEKIGRRCECRVYTNAEHGFFYDLTRRQQNEAFADILNFIESLELPANLKLNPKSF